MTAQIIPLPIAKRTPVLCLIDPPVSIDARYWDLHAKPVGTLTPAEREELSAMCNAKEAAWEALNGNQFGDAR